MRKSLYLYQTPSLRVSVPRYVSAIWSAASTQAHIRLDTWAPCRIHDGCHGAHIATSYTCTGCCLRSTQRWGGGGRGTEGWEVGGHREEKGGKLGGVHVNLCFFLVRVCVCVCVCFFVGKEEAKQKKTTRQTEEERGISWSVNLREMGKRLKRGANLRLTALWKATRLIWRDRHLKKKNSTYCFTERLNKCDCVEMGKTTDWMFYRKDM